MGRVTFGGVVVVAAWYLAAGPVAWAGDDALVSDYVVAGRRAAAQQVREGVPTLIHVAMDGVVLDRCPDDDISAAKRCTSLMPGPTVFPAWGTTVERAAVMQAARGLFGDFDVTLVDEPPPPFVPHMLAVVGGTSSLIGQQTTSCGLATLVCGGQRRDLVSLTFAHSCGGWDSPTRVAATIAQETAHNLGLEHVNVADDVMFPTVSQVEQTFRDACLDILTPDYDDAYVCPDVHALDCPDDAGARQNSYAELMRLLGPADPDAAPPQIVSVEPADGAVLDAGASIRISARIAHDSDAIGVRWSWLEGPSASGDHGPGTTRCTNDVCDLDYARDKSVDSDWDFIELDAPAAGAYVFQLEVADPHGHHESRTITFDVDAGATDSSTGSTTADADPDAEDGCGCRTSPHAATWLAMLVALVSTRRWQGERTSRAERPMDARSADTHAERDCPTVAHCGHGLCT